VCFNKRRDEPGRPVAYCRVQAVWITRDKEKASIRVANAIRARRLSSRLLHSVWS